MKAWWLCLGFFVTVGASWANAAEVANVSFEQATDGSGTVWVYYDVSDQDGDLLIITIDAGDLTALRAAMNSFLAWISGSVRAVESVTGQNP